MQPSTAKPKSSGPDLAPATDKQARAALAPIIRRSKAAGYKVTSPKGEVLVVSGEGTDTVTLAVFATPAGARDSGRSSAESIKAGRAGPDDFAVIGNHYWDSYEPGKTEQFRKLVETAEGCAPKCRFSMSSF